MSSMTQRDEGEVTVGSEIDDAERYADCAHFFLMTIEEVLALKDIADLEDEVCSSTEEQE